MLLLERIHRFNNKVLIGKHSIFLPGIVVPIHNNVLAIIENESGKTLHVGHNIVTDKGDIYYSQRGAAETPTDTYAEFTVSTNPFSPTPVKGTDAGDLVRAVATGTPNLAFTATYPKSNDTGDVDNTGDAPDVVSWAVSYAKTDFDDPSIEGVCIHETAATFGTGTDPLLMAVNLTAFSKTADDTLKIFVNHNMNGIA